MFLFLFYEFTTLGGINLYTTGVTTLDSNVELINPPIKTIARGLMSGLVDIEIGHSSTECLAYEKVVALEENGLHQHSEQSPSGTGPVQYIFTFLKKIFKRSFLY